MSRLKLMKILGILFILGPGYNALAAGDLDVVMKHNFANPKKKYNNLYPEDAKRVQETLKSYGYYDGPIDGILGDRTTQAVKVFQKNHKLVQTGNFDEQTLARLNAQTEKDEDLADVLDEKEY